MTAPNVDAPVLAQEPADLDDGPPPVERCPGCHWADCSDHDELLTIQENAAALADLLAWFVTWPSTPSEGDEERVRAIDVPDFVREHNWPDPREARWLADNLQEIIEALHPRADVGSAE